MEILERGPVLERLDAHLAAARQGSGRLVVLYGEAGIGKTSVARRFCSTHGNDAHVMWGSCDDLITPQPLGAVWDMVLAAPSLEELLLDERPQRVFHAIHQLLSRSLRPTVMVIEDIHWADESTMDLIRYIGRRVDQTHGLVIVTYRDDQPDDGEPVRFALGDLPAEALERIPVKPLSQGALAQLGGETWDADELWRLTDGNPFFVTELIEAGPESVPASIKDAIGAKLARLSPRSRDLAELVSVVPGQVELSLLDEILDDSSEAMAESERGGVLLLDGTDLRFRHELARQAVQDQLPEIRRRALNATMLRAAESRKEDLALQAHLARESGDALAVLRILPQAARRAAELGSHREALSHLQALQTHLDLMDPDQLSDVYQLWAREAYLTGDSDMAVLAQKAVDLRRQEGDPLLLGKALVSASEITWWTGDHDQAVSLAKEAASVLAPVGGEDLAMAYSTLARWAELATDLDATLGFVEKTLQLLDDRPTLAAVQALCSRGAIIAATRYPDGLQDIEESYRMAESLGLVWHQARAAHNLGGMALLSDRDLGTARRWQETALHLWEDAEMPGSTNGPLAELAWIEELSGNWAGAERLARRVTQRSLDGIHNVDAECVLARVRTRRGDPEASNAASTAWTMAVETGESLRLGPAGAVVLESNSLGFVVDDSLTDEILEAYRSHSNPDTRLIFSETAFWLSRIGAIDQVPEDSLEPFVMLGQGDWDAAASWWGDRDIPYEKALCLSFGNAEAKLEALAILDHLGARPLARRIREELKSADISVPRGPIEATRESPLGLTARQTEVLDLMAEELTNAEIAERLFVSKRTVDSHVSAILTKLEAQDRAEAVTKARRLVPDE